MKTKLLTLIFGMFFLVSLGLTSGLTWGNIQNGECVNLGTICPLSSCNLTNITLVTYPNTTASKTNVLATHNGDNWIYEYCNTEANGIYKVYGYSSNGTNEEKFIGDFEVTSYGMELSVGFYIILLILSLLLVIIGYGAEDEWLVILGSFGFILLGLFILRFGITNIQDTSYTMAFGIITIFTGAYFAIRAGISKIIG